MPISILDETQKNNIPDWKEIFIGASNKEPEQQISTEEFSTEKTAILRKIKEQILKNIASDKIIRFSPLQFLESDLFGNFHYKKNSIRTLLENGKDVISEREIELIRFLFDELYLLAKEMPSHIDDEITSMLFAILASEGKIEELETFLADHPQNKIVASHLNSFFYLLGKSNDVDLGNIQDDKELYYLCKMKKSGLDEFEENALYDIVIFGKNRESLGAVYVIFSKKFSGLRNAFPIFQIVLNIFDSLTLEEKKRFIEDFIATNKYLKVYFLMKKIYAREEITKWLQNELSANGKKKLTRNPEEHEKKLTLGARAHALEIQGLIYTLSPFEILTLLNSQIGETVRSDIYSAVKRLPNSYLIQRSLSVLCFFDGDYQSFFQSQLKSGRLRYGSESLYLKAIALKESGLTEEGDDILLALEKKYPDSNILKSAKENHKI